MKFWGGGEQIHKDEHVRISWCLLIQTVHQLGSEVALMTYGV